SQAHTSQVQEMDDRQPDLAPKATSEPESRRKRPRLVLSVRALMILVLIVGGGAGWYLNNVRTQQEAVDAIRKAGGDVVYDTEYVGPGSPAPQIPAWRSWIDERIGPDWLGRVVEVRATLNDSSAALTSCIGRLRDVRNVVLQGDS